MKNTVFLLIIILSACCNQEKKSDNAGKITPKDEFIDTPPVETTAITPEKFEEFPLGFESGSFSLEDTTLHFSYDLHFPKSLKYKKFNQLLERFVKEQAMLEVKGKTDKENTTFSLWLHDFKISGNLIECVFICQSFTEGAAHYNHGYKSFNYDIQKNKRILLTDIIHFPSVKQKEVFCDQYNEFNPGSDLLPEHMAKNTDFCIDSNRLILYFDDYEYAISMHSIEFEMGQIKPYLRPDAIKAYSLLK